MVFGFGEFFGECLGVAGRDASDEHAAALLENFGGDFDDLRGSFASAEDDLGEALPQGAVLIDLCEAEISDRFLAKRGEGLRLADFAGAEILKQLGGLGGGHAG